LVYDLADHVGGGGATNSGGGARLPMSSAFAEEEISIEQRLDAEVNLDDVEYQRIVDRIGADAVSRFNSSI
jgi:hypothetical protein